MPFTKVGKDDYQSPSGRHFNGAQVRLWHANGDKFPGQKTSEAPMNKGYQGKVESYAEGGLVLGRTKDFVKEPDRFREGQFKYKGDQHTPQPQPTDDVFDKGGESCAPPVRGKALPPVKARG